MPLRRVLSRLSVLALLGLSGCGYVHFGRMPAPPEPVVMGDDKLLKENANLRTEKKLLQQELALTRAQGDALRMAIENRTSDGDTSKRLTEKLTQTTRELASLRSEYAKLQQDRAAAPASAAEIADLKSKLSATEDRLAGALKNYTQLQGEVAQLRTDLDKSRKDNVALTEQVKVITAKNEEVQAALATLNADLLTQKESRTRAEQDAATLRTQLDTANSKLSVLQQTRTAAAAEAKSLAPADSAAPATAADADTRAQLDVLRKKVWALEAERNDLQQQLAAIETAGKAPGIAELKARAEKDNQLKTALESAKMLRDENDQLKAAATEAAKQKSELEANLAQARAALPLAAQAGTLRDQLNAAQAQAAALADENSKLKARLAGASGGTSREGGGGTPVISIPSSSGGVTATLVTSVSAPSGARPAAGITRSTPSGTLRFHNVTAGDTLSKISQLYYGTPSRWAEILVANRDILGEDNNLVIGRTLRIP